MTRHIAAKKFSHILNKLPGKNISVFRKNTEFSFNIDGKRIQYSLFRCWLSQRGREKQRWELEKVLKTEDSLLLIRLSDQCVSGIRAYNRPDAWSSVETGYRIV